MLSPNILNTSSKFFQTPAKFHHSKYQQYCRLEISGGLYLSQLGVERFLRETKQAQKKSERGNIFYHMIIIFMSMGIIFPKS